MAQLKTLKNGELYLMKDGSAHQLFTGTATGHVAGYEYNGTWNVMVTSGDMFRRTGNHFLSHDYDASSATAFNPTQSMFSPVFISRGSTVYMYYSYDSAGGSARSIHLATSSDGGASWSAVGEMEPLGTGGSWNDSAMYPCGIAEISSTAWRLYVLGFDGSLIRLGAIDIDATSGLTLIDSASYTANASNPLTGGLNADYAAVNYDGSKYHMWHSNSSSSQYVYYNQSNDGITWPDSLTEHVAMSSGVSGTKDDTYIRVRGSYYKDGWHYLFYTGNDGTNSYAMLALSQHPDRLVKCGNIEAPAATALANLSSDVTFTIPDQHQHISNRGRPGVLADAGFVPVDLSFSMKFEGMSSDGTYATASTGSVNLYNYILKVSPSVREGVGHATGKSSVNILFRQDSDSSGTKDDFWLFLDCHPVTTQLSEAADGNTVNVVMRSYGGKMPLWGRY